MIGQTLSPFPLLVWQRGKIRVTGFNISETCASFQFYCMLLFLDFLTFRHKILFDVKIKI